jgi:hypothetical protein
MTFNNKSYKLAKNILKPVNTAAMIILGVYTFLWGFWVGNPFWTVFDQAPLYNWMERFAPEAFWGLVAMAVGVLMTYGVLRHSYKSLVFGALVGYFHWLIIAIMYLGADWQNTGGITSLVISFYCGFIWLNITKNKENLSL